MGGPAWEYRRETGWLRAAAKTCSQVLFHAEDTFERARRTGGLVGPLMFLLIMGVGFGMLTFAMNSAFNTVNPAQMEDTYRTLDELYGPEIAQKVRNIMESTMDPNPILVFMGLFLWRVLEVFLYSLLVHVCLMICGASEGGFEATFRAFAYCLGATAPVAIIPVCGALVGLIWFTIVIVLALTRIHDTTTTRVIIGLTLASLPLLCCAGASLGIVVMGLAGTM